MKPFLLILILMALSAVPTLAAQQPTDDVETAAAMPAAGTTVTPNPSSSVPEMTTYDPVDPTASDVPDAPLTEDPLDAAETSATMAVIGVDSSDTGIDDEKQEEADAARVAAMVDALKPYGRGDMELAIGLGGSSSGYDSGFTLSASAVFAYYVINRLAPGMEIDYLATFGDVDYPQSITLFPFIKFVLLRSQRFAPFLLAGGGRTLEWGGADPEVDANTGALHGFSPVSSWVTGIGGGAMIGIGARARLQLQLLAMHRVYDTPVWKELSLQQTTEWDDNGIPTTTYSLTGDRVKRLWYPAPSIWFSFAL